MVTKTRKDIVKECAQAAQACWQHYADQYLDSAVITLIEQSLDSLLPEKITTDKWSAYATYYDSLRNS